MVLASGGFGADFGSDSLLATYRRSAGLRVVRVAEKRGTACMAGWPSMA